MIRIVGVQRNAFAEQEFVLLQNQGSHRISLRGHLVLSDGAWESGDMNHQAHVFRDDVDIPPDMYVILFSGQGLPRWAQTKDGTQVYYAYMGRESSVWGQADGPLHVLHRTHSFSQDREALLVS